MIESGVVLETDGSMAKIRFLRTSACGKCNACGFKKDQNEIVIETENTLGAKPGDRVRMEISQGSVLKASLYAYIFPLVMLVLGLVAGYLIGEATGIFKDPEIFSAICGIVLTGLSFLIIRKTEPYLKKRIKSVFKMMEISE